MIRDTESTPPGPAADATAVSARLVARIGEVIDIAGGSIGFDRYMEMALYEPGLGYYSAGAVKLGGEGDFVTAPEISPLFGRSLARQAAQVLGVIGGGAILEFGAGSGRLAVDVLVEMERLGVPPDAYLILEVSADLRDRQRGLFERDIPQWLPRIRWLDCLPELPLRGVVLANEVLDAMPVARFRKRDDARYAEQRVIKSGDGFGWTEADVAAGSPLAAAIDAIEQECGPLPVGYVSEANLRLPPWLRALAHVLKRGAAFLIDYGYPHREYYHPQRRDGTLLCHYRHRAHDDPFAFVGLQDITASVDFTAAAIAAQDAGFSVAGYTTQAQFLLSLGLMEMCVQSAPDGAVERLQIAQQIKRLTLPGEMGERFKVLAVTRDFDAPLAGFGLANHRERL